MNSRRDVAEQIPNEGQACTYYDKDGRQVELASDDLAWAQAEGLIARKVCR